MGFTPYTPSIVNRSPSLNAYVPRPDKSSDEPDWPAPETTGVDAVNVPVVNATMFESHAHSSTPRAPNPKKPLRKMVEIVLCGLNWVRLFAWSLLCCLGSMTAFR